MTKNEIRDRIRARRKSLDPNWIRQASGEVQHAASLLPEFQTACLVSCYLAADTEVQTDQIVGNCHQAGKTVCVPWFRKDTGNYEWSILAPETEVGLGPLGIRQPCAIAALPPNSTIDLILVPGLAFDASGRRIGYGGGNYDRLLKAHEVPVRFSVGLAFEFQILDEVPYEPHDMNVDAVVTDHRVLRTAKGLS
ncbi:MAG: 5-formyltetrahydrofolate cyclo-ligase [Lentisphaerales bacterium]|jgi:5-formyltetrahydrofolate cyclo-ligase|nr:MAG: 5-formyltetrahydrofolate cyclo-ligase [Lentisphaerales bacterium]